MARIDRCLDPDEVMAFQRGGLGSGDLVALEGHLARCADCRVLLSLLARSESVASTRSPTSQATTGSAPGAAGDADADPVPGSRIGRYVLQERLGAGAMGVVFAAHDPELDRKVAVKLLRSDADVDASRTPLRARLLREARAMARLAHPNVVTVHDVGAAGDRIFIAMELVEGQTLARWLAAERQPVRDVIAMFIAAGHGLAAAHAAGLVHRDFKPENVLIGKDGRVRVTDFGVAHRTATPVDRAAASTDAADAADRGRTTTGLLAGTPFYMAPEQIACEGVDARSDQFSFCVAIYAALTGEHPLSTERSEPVRADRRARIALPAWLWRALRRGLAVDRNLRYPAMNALLSRLAVGPRRRRRIWLGSGVAATVLATVAGLVWGTGDRRRTCEGAERLLAGTWDAERALGIDAAFRKTGSPNAAAAFSSASRLLDRYARSWTAMRMEACEATHIRHTQPEAILNLRNGCLDARLSELRALTERLAAADAALVDAAVGSVQALGTLGICADESALQSPIQSDVAARAGAIAAMDADHRLSYFASDAGGSLWQIRQRSAGGPWDRIHVLDAIASRPAIVADGDHRWQLFARCTDGTLWRSWQEVPGGAWRAVQLTNAATDDPAAVLVGTRLVYFVRRTDGWLWRYWQDASGSWTPVRVADVATGKPGVAFDVAGELYSFVRKADGSLWYARHRGPTDAAERAVKLVDNIAGDPTVVLDAVDKMTFYVRSNSGALFTGYQDAAGSPVWHSVRLTDGVTGDPDVAFDPSGRQTCVIRKTNGSLWSGRQDTRTGGDWHETILSEGIADDPTIVRDADGRLTYVVRKTDGVRWQGQQATPLDTTWHEHALP